jgi:hypothetical protein
MGAAALLVVAAAACGTPPTTPGSASQDQLPVGVSRDQVVPAEGVAKDVRGTPPCELITAEQAERLGIDSATAESDPPGTISGCRWSSLDRTFGVGVTVDTARGLTNLYRGHARVPYKTFEPMRVDGFPAVRADVVEDGLDCTIYVGLAETQTMWVRGTQRQGGDSCAIARPVISAILATIPPLR